MTISPASLPSGVMNAAYGPVTFSATGNTGTVTFAISGTTLPAGITFNSTNGTLSATNVTESGVFNGIVITATDTTTTCQSQATYSITILPTVANYTFNTAGNTQVVAGSAPSSPYVTASNLLTSGAGTARTVAN